MRFAERIAPQPNKGEVISDFRYIVSQLDMFCIHKTRNSFKVRFNFDEH